MALRLILAVVVAACGTFAQQRTVSSSTRPGVNDNADGALEGTRPEKVLAVVKARGTMVFVRGQVGQDIDGFESMENAGPYEQADRAMQNVKQLLEEAGSELAHICRIQVYITDRAYRDDVYQAIGKWLKGVFPCQTGLIVNGLAKPEMLMEIDVEAIIPDEKT